MPIFWLVHAIEREEKRERKERSFLPRSTEFHGSSFVGPRTKFIASTRGTRGYLKIGISPKIKDGRFREIEVIEFRRLSTHVSRA